ncbi:DUF3343 domain-containing protein [Dethiobacter alkaliphilus]|uniref:DUF3343 domain-containing protein n=1 Tax=Dethiobacter alkaliphilus TaxID=427926 RepID=UPI0022280BB5|nr:DUF3343 domain-containing protein [Dethiobacter alkaliphilus]MCW3490731.1 DUF3343 domain-containing protein [Dethiobacter alkaliphilus]
MERFYVGTFHSVSHALRFEKLLKNHNLDVAMIPVPRVISSSCGIAARFSEQALPSVQRLLTEDGDDVESIYLLSYEGKKVHAERLAGPWDNDS